MGSRVASEVGVREVSPALHRAPVLAQRNLTPPEAGVDPGEVVEDSGVAAPLERREDFTRKVVLVMANVEKGRLQRRLLGISPLAEARAARRIANPRAVGAGVAGVSAARDGQGPPVVAQQRGCANEQSECLGPLHGRPSMPGSSPEELTRERQRPFRYPGGTGTVGGSLPVQGLMKMVTMLGVKTELPSCT
jgi:hypothetical protein